MIRYYGVMINPIPVRRSLFAYVAAGANLLICEIEYTHWFKSVRLKSRIESKTVSGKPLMKPQNSPKL